MSLCFICLDNVNTQLYLLQHITLYRLFSKITEFKSLKYKRYRTFNYLNLFFEIQSHISYDEFNLLHL